MGNIYFPSSRTKLPKNCQPRDTKKMNTFSLLLRLDNQSSTSQTYIVTQCPAMSFLISFKRTKSRGCLDTQQRPRPSLDSPVLRVSQVRKLNGRGRCSGRWRGSRGQGSTTAASLSFAPGPPWQMESSPGQQSCTEATAATMSGPKCALQKWQAALSPPWDRQPPLPCWALSWATLLRSPWNQRSFEPKRPYIQNQILELEDHLRVCCCHCLTCIKSCKRLSDLVILLVNLINHSNWIEWSDKK